MEIDFLMSFCLPQTIQTPIKKGREFLSQNLAQRGNMDLCRNICGPKLKKNSEYS